MRLALWIFVGDLPLIACGFAGTQVRFHVETQETRGINPSLESAKTWGCSSTCRLCIHPENSPWPGAANGTWLRGGPEPLLSTFGEDPGHQSEVRIPLWENKGEECFFWWDIRISATKYMGIYDEIVGYRTNHMDPYGHFNRDFWEDFLLMMGISDDL